jgi:hypothetical protein
MRTFRLAASAMLGAAIVAASPLTVSGFVGVDGEAFAQGRGAGGSGGGNGGGMGGAGASAGGFGAGMGAAASARGQATAAAARDPSTRGLEKAAAVLATTPASEQAKTSVGEALARWFARQETETPDEPETIE